MQAVAAGGAAGKTKLNAALLPPAVSEVKAWISAGAPMPCGGRLALSKVNGLSKDSVVRAVAVWCVQYTGNNSKMVELSNFKQKTYTVSTAVLGNHFKASIVQELSKKPAWLVCDVSEIEAGDGEFADDDNGGDGDGCNEMNGVVESGEEDKQQLAKSDIASLKPSVSQKCRIYHVGICCCES